MAKETEDSKSPDQPASKGVSADLWPFSRSAIPYFLAALIAASAMAWYFFVFVPTKLEYFVGLRFRTLAVASGHVQNKVENLAKALSVVPTAIREPDGECAVPTDAAKSETSKYLEYVLPEIQEDRNNHASATGFPLTACGIKGTVAWADVVAQASAASRRNFDDLILADDKGDVQWQRELSTPRIGNLSELLGAADDSASWSPFRWRAHVTAPAQSDRKYLRSTALLKPVNIGGTSSLLLVQSVTIPPEQGMSLAKQPGQDARHLYVAGLVSSAGLQRQAMQIPVAWLVFFLVPVALLLLALPFVKLGTLTAKERYSFVDVVAMTLATIAAVGMGAIVPFATMSTGATDRILDTFSGKLQERLADETTKVLSLADEIVKKPREGGGALSLGQCASSGSGLVKRDGKIDRNECALWQALGRQSPELDLDVVIWFNDRGEQIRKWTTKAQITGPAPHRSFNHYRDVVAGRLWRLANRANGAVIERPFTIEPLRAPTTSEMGVIFAMPLDDGKSVGKATSDPLPPGSRTFFALNVRPQSVVDSLVPPGYGFAIIAPDGKVLFHSAEGLSLEENFFEETGKPTDVREKAQSTRLVRWTGDYHGRPHRLRMEPFTAFFGSPWLIVTFQEMDPVLSALLVQQSDTLRLGTLSLLLLTLIVILYLLYSRFRHRRLRDLTQDILARPSNVRRARLIIALGTIEGIALLASLHPLAHSWLDALYATFVAVPVAALLLMLVFRTWSGVKPAVEPAGAALSEPAKPLPPREAFARGLSGFKKWSTETFARMISASELGVVILVIAAFPAFGFARIVQIVHDGTSRERWHEIVQQRLSERQDRVRERISGPNYGPIPKSAFELDSATPDVSSPYSYLSILPPIESPASTEPKSFVQRLLEWNPMLSSDETRRPVDGEPVRPIRRDPADATVVEPSWSVSRISLALGLLILSGFLALAYWARSKLLPPGVVAVPDLVTVLERVPNSGNDIVLLVGPPRSNKDDAVVRAVKTRAKEEPVKRIRLLDKTVDERFIKETLQSVDDAIQARVVPQGHKGPVWIHVSHLESQLVDKASRMQVLRLLERLLDIRPNQVARALVVTSSIDPVAHFKELFLEERQGVYKDAVPEVSLGRSTRILSRFRRCYAPIGPSKKRTDGSITLWERWWNYNPLEWKKTLAIELDGFRPFIQVRDELRTAWRGRTTEGVAFDDLVRAVRLRTAASYELLWASCTRSEKLVLIQLAQEGFVTAQSWDVVAPLVAKGLIVQQPVLAIFNHTFRDFLLGIERSAVVQAWERMDGYGLWVVAGRLIGSSLLAGGLFYLTTQDFSVQSLLPIVSGTGLFGVPMVRTLVARLSGKPEASVSV